MKPLIPLDDVRQSNLPPLRPEGQDDRGRLHESVVGVVVSVYPVDHPRNDMGQMLADVQVSHLLPLLKRVPLATGYAHEETPVATANSRDRQPYEPKARNQQDGCVYDVRPGTRVLVQFLGGDLRAPMIVATVKFNRQGEREVPVERQGVDRFIDDGHFGMVEATPLDSSLSEYPRAVDTYNGTKIERDNCGNFTVQTTTDQDPVFPGHNGVPPSPDPQGNVLFSTRGAKSGRVGILTGKSPLSQGTSDGTVRIETATAERGSLIAWLRSKIGRIWISTRGSDDGSVYVENQERSYLSLKGEQGGLHAAAKTFLDAAEVCLGNLDPQYHAVLWEPLNDFVQQVLSTYDGHTHGGVESGDSNTLQPNQLLTPLWLLQFEMGNKYKSDHVRLVKAEGATPEYETDPDGGDSAPAPTPDPPAPTEPPRRKKGGAGGGGFFLDPNVPRDKLGRRIKTP